MCTVIQMGVKERKEREKENLRQYILDAASEMFAREGYQTVSMRKIAERIEYSPTTIYLYFRDKNDLLNQICEQTFAKLSQTLEKIEDKTSEPVDCLRRGMRAYVEFGLKFPNHYDVTFITPILDFMGNDAPAYEDSNGQKAFEHISRQVALGIEAKQFKPGDVAVVSQTIWAAIHGVTALLIGHRDFPFVEKKVLIESVIETTLKGLRA